MNLTWVPLAWLNLTHHKQRFAVAVAGISFAVVLMFVQFGFWNALVDGSVALIDQLDADLVIVNRSKDMLSAAEPFTRRRLEQAGEIAGVRSVSPLYLDPRVFSWKNPEAEEQPPLPPGGFSALLRTGPRGGGGVPDERPPNVFPIRVIAFDPLRPALKSPAVLSRLQDLMLPGAVLLDDRSKSRYGRREADLRRELSGSTVRVVGVFSLGTDFINNANLVMSDTTYADLRARVGLPVPLTQVELGLVRLEPWASEAAVLTALTSALPDDVEVMTVRELRRREQDFWRNHTPVGFVFGLGLVMGLVVGVVICYQILSAEVSDRLAEFATLKAIGYGNAYLMGVVIQEGVYLALLGYVPGLALSHGLYLALGMATGLPLQVTIWTASVVAVLAVGMCAVSGSLVVRKVQRADPAEVF